MQDGVVDPVRAIGHCGDQPKQLRLQLVEQSGHLGRAGAWLIVVEQRVVGAFIFVETVDVAPDQLEVALQVRDEAGEVRVPASGDPGLLPDRGGTGQIGRQLAGHPPRLLPAPPDHPHQRRLVGIGGGAVEAGRCRLDQPPGVIRDEHLVADPLDGGHRLRPGRRAPGRHHRLLVPVEELGRRCAGRPAPPVAVAVVRGDLSSRHISRRTDAAPVRPLQHVAAAHVDQADGPVRISGSGSIAAGS